MGDPARRRRAAEWHLSRWQRALDHFTGDGTERRLLLALSTFANPDGMASPGLEALARRAGLHRATVARRAPLLEMSGWVARVTTGGGQGRRTVWQLTIPGTVAAEATLSGSGTVARGKTVPKHELSQDGQGTVAGESEELSHARAHGDPRTEVNRENRDGTSDERAAFDAPYRRAGLTWKQFMALPPEERAALKAAFDAEAPAVPSPANVEEPISEVPT